MKRTPVHQIPEGIPESLRAFLVGATLYDSSCSPEARVWLIERDRGYYLKKSGKGMLKKEAEMNAYFHKKGLGPEVLAYVSDAEDWLLTARVAGEDCTHAQYLDDPRRLCDMLAESLRMLHELDGSDCPVQDRMAVYFATVEENYRKGFYDLSYASDDADISNKDAAYALCMSGKDALDGRVLLHGDYCLPNILLDRWKLSGFIDLGNGGVGDRHIDLYWGAWTLRYNLGSDRWRDRFFDAYGRELVDKEKIRIVAAAEVFG